MRQCSGQLRLVNLNEQTFPDAVSLRLTLNAVGRQPQWLAWDSARDLQVVQPVQLKSKLVLVGPNGLAGENFAQQFFEARLREPLQVTLFAEKAKSATVDALTYALWIGFRSGPPLYLPVTVG